jgi:gamma-glutamyltranspeptidase
MNEASAQYGAIASPHHLATQAGERAFQHGGNAIDAAIAAAAVLTVVYPNNVSIGGDLVALVRLPNGVIHCVNATGYAPATVDVPRLRTTYGERLPDRGVDTITVPGGVAGWGTLGRIGGRMAWEEYFTDAIALAAAGAPLAHSVAEALLREPDELRRDRGFRDIFFPGDKVIREGETLIQAALARSLERLRDGGERELYDGSLADDLVTGLAGLGASLTRTDLANFSPEVVEPLSGTFREFDIVTSPPNTQGFMLLRALEQLEHLGDPDNILNTDPGLLASIFVAANDVRTRMLADPQFDSISVTELLHASARLEGSRHASPNVKARGDTVGIATIDSDGVAVSLIQSVFHAFGSGVLEPATGILMHNRGSSFSLDADSPNVIAPGKRPKHTLMPVMVSRDGSVQWVSATMGGQGQPQIHAQILLRSFAGATAKEAVDAPRWLVGAQDPGDTDTNIYVEQDAGSSITQSLTDAGLDVISVPKHDETLGQANLIRVDSNLEFDAASDPRSDGSAQVIRLSDL